MALHSSLAPNSHAFPQLRDQPAASEPSSPPTADNVSLPSLLLSSCKTPLRPLSPSRPAEALPEVEDGSPPPTHKLRETSETGDSCPQLGILTSSSLHETSPLQAPHHFLLGEALAKGISPKRLSQRKNCSGDCEGQRQKEDSPCGDFSFLALQPSLCACVTCLCPTDDTSVGQGSAAKLLSECSPRDPLGVHAFVTADPHLQTPNQKKAETESFFTPLSVRQIGQCAMTPVPRKLSLSSKDLASAVETHPMTPIPTPPYFVKQNNSSEKNIRDRKSQSAKERLTGETSKEELLLILSPFLT